VPCVNKPEWKNSLGMTCEIYELFNDKTNICQTFSGKDFGFPKQNCCVCGGVDPELSNPDAVTCEDTKGWQLFGFFTCEHFESKPRLCGYTGKDYDFPESNCCACGKPVFDAQTYLYGEGDCEDTKDFVSNDIRKIGLTCDDYSIYDGLMDGLDVCKEYGGAENRYPEDNCCYCGKTVCTNTPDWKNDYDLTCAMYEALMTQYDVCGEFSGEAYGYPEKNCCVCREGITIKEVHAV